MLWNKASFGCIALLCGSAGLASGQINAVRGKVTKIGPQGLMLQLEDASAGQEQAIQATARTPVRVNYLASIDQIVPGTYVQMQVLWDGENRLRATSITLPRGRPDKLGLFEG
jgi:hypothetical protein